MYAFSAGCVLDGVARLLGLLVSVCGFCVMPSSSWSMYARDAEEMV